MCMCFIRPESHVISLFHFIFLALCTVIQQILRAFNSSWEQDHWDHASSNNPNPNLETVWCSCSWWGSQHLGSLLWTWCFVRKSCTSLCNTVCIFQVKPQHWQISLVLSGLTDELDFHTTVLQAIWHSGDVTLLDQCINEAVLWKKGAKPVGHRTEEGLSYHTLQRDGAQNWSICLKFSSKIQTPSETLNCETSPPDDTQDLPQAQK